MKKACLLLLAFVLTAFISDAQDIITLTNGAQIQAKVLEINPGDIKYKDFNNMDGPTITVQKEGVSAIRYANGQKTVFNPTHTTSSGAGYKREPGGNHGYKKSSEKNAKLHGWYFGANLSYGISSATSADPAYSPSGGVYTAGNLLATKMFNQHIGIQFGLGTETYSYGVAYNSTSSYGYGNDVFTLSCLTLPVRALYISNSKRRAGLYVLAGFDLTFIAVATDQENDNLTGYYNSVMFSPYISSGVAFRSRNARGVWLLGPYFKTTLSNSYSGQSDNAGILAPGNTGTINSAGLSVEYMGKFGRGR